ncbi:hypothetical protein BLNAU_4160 [Blattamonas nauphoetae]|uniref:Uncharacterized protein n=1 Tax=Blattamonas nauphoetae TaxID=2049346 RepID=A0ABQ9YAF5_9EUKA|nr:hypothetical protein BLNAU_4160 [Blattamonas nauphoetae]
MFQWPTDPDNNKSNVYIRTDGVLTKSEGDSLEKYVRDLLQEQANKAVELLLSKGQIEGKKTDVRVELKPTRSFGFDGYCALSGPAQNGDLMNKLLDELVRMNHSGSHISHDRPQNTAELHFPIHGQQHSPSSTTKNVKVKISKPNALIKQSQDSQSTLRIPAGSSYGLFVQTESDIDESDVEELTQTITSHLTRSMTSIIQATPLFSHLQGFVPGLDLNFHQRTTFVFHGHAFFDGLDLGDQMLVADKVIELSRNDSKNPSRADQHKMGEKVKLTFKCPERIVPLCIRLDPPSFFGPGLIPHNAPILHISSSVLVNENEIDCLHKFLSDLISNSIGSITQQSGERRGRKNDPKLFDLSLQSDRGILSGKCTLKIIDQSHQQMVIEQLKSSDCVRPFPDPPDIQNNTIKIDYPLRKSFNFRISVNRSTSDQAPANIPRQPTHTPPRQQHTPSHNHQPILRPISLHSSYTDIHYPPLVQHVVPIVFSEPLPSAQPPLNPRARPFVPNRPSVSGDTSPPTQSNQFFNFSPPSTSHINLSSPPFSQLRPTTNEHPVLEEQTPISQAAQIPPFPLTINTSSLMDPMTMQQEQEDSRGAPTLGVGLSSPPLSAHSQTGTPNAGSSISSVCDNISDSTQKDEERSIVFEFYPDLLSSLSDVNSPPNSSRSRHSHLSIGSPPDPADQLVPSEHADQGILADSNVSLSSSSVSTGSFSSQNSRNPFDLSSSISSFNSRSTIHSAHLPSSDIFLLEASLWNHVDSGNQGLPFDEDGVLEQLEPDDDELLSRVSNLGERTNMELHDVNPSDTASQNSQASSTATSNGQPQPSRSSSAPPSSNQPPSNTSIPNDSQSLSPPSEGVWNPDDHFDSWDTVYASPY